MVDPVGSAEQVVDSPVGKGVAEERSRGERGGGATSDTELSQDGANIGLGERNHEVRTANLGHGGNNKVCVHILNKDALGSQLGTNGLGPAGEEGLGARVDRQIGGGNKSSKRSEVDDQSVLAIAVNISIVDKEEEEGQLLERVIEEWLSGGVRVHLFTYRATICGTMILVTFMAALMFTSIISLRTLSLSCSKGVGISWLVPTLLTDTRVAWVGDVQGKEIINAICLVPVRLYSDRSRHSYQAR